MPALKITHLFGLMVIFLLISCRAQHTQIEGLPAQVHEMIFDQQAQELLVKTERGVFRYSDQGIFIQAARPKLERRFEVLKLQQEHLSNSGSAGKTIVEDIAPTPWGMVSYNSQTRELFVSSSASYPRLIATGLERPEQALYVPVNGRLYLTLPEARKMLSVILRPAL